MASILTNRGMYLVLSADVDLRDDTIKVMLLNSAFAPLATHNVVSDISASELTGTGYVAGFAGSGRKTLASKTLTEVDADGVAIFDAADLTWTGINAGTTNCCAIIKEVTTDADSLVIGFVTFTSRITSGSALTVAWHADGIFRITAWAGEITNVRVVSYTATGAEGTDFPVTIGTPTAATTYNVFWSPAGTTNVPILDLPTSAGTDRTTTTFRVLTGDTLSAGAVLKFLIVE